MAMPSNEDELREFVRGVLRQSDLGNRIRQQQGGLWHRVGDPGEPGYQNSWVDFGAGNAPAGFRRFGSQVCLRGTVKSGSVNATIFTLPSGYCPPFTLRFPVISNNAAAYLAIDAAGNVWMPSGGSNVFVDLASVSFDTTA